MSLTVRCLSHETTHECKANWLFSISSFAIHSFALCSSSDGHCARALIHLSTTRTLDTIKHNRRATTPSDGWRDSGEVDSNAEKHAFVKSRKEPQTVLALVRRRAQTEELTQLRIAKLADRFFCARDISSHFREDFADHSDEILSRHPLGIVDSLDVLPSAAYRPSPLRSGNSSRRYGDSAMRNA